MQNLAIFVIPMLLIRNEDVLTGGRALARHVGLKADLLVQTSSGRINRRRVERR